MTVWSIFENLIVLVFSAILLPLLIGMSLAEKTEPLQVTANNQFSGVLQDGILYSISAILSELIAIFLLPEITTTWTDVVSILGFGCAIVTFISLVDWPFLYCVANNIQHYEDRKDYAENYVGDRQAGQSDIDYKIQNQKDREKLKEQLPHLYKHLKMQNILAFLVTFPYSVVAVLIIARDYIKSDEPGFKNIWYKFVPKE